MCSPNHLREALVTVTEVRYVGPHDSVDIVANDGRIYTAKRNEAIELPADVAGSLLEQDTWERVKKSKGDK